jgi:hypothetical protein
MASLGVNIDHIANVRQARRAVEPDPVSYALLAELVSREDGAIDGPAPILVTQLRFAITGGIYRHDVAAPVPEMPGVDDV